MSTPGAVGNNRIPMQDQAVAAAQHSRPPRERWLLGARGRKSVLILHLTLTAALLGGLASMLLLLASGDAAISAAARAGLDRAVFIISDTLVTHTAIAFVLTGLAFSLGTAWGFVRYRWISAKWLLLLGLGLFVALVLTPTAGDVAGRSDALLDAAYADAVYLTQRRALSGYTGALLAVVLGIVALSVFKPGDARHAHRPLRARGAWALAATAASVLLVVLLAAQARQLHVLRTVAVPPLEVALLADGTYDGAASDGHFTYRVRAQVRGGRISQIDILENRASRYARLAELVALKVQREQRLDIDALSGATTTSKVLLLAISDALRKGEPRQR